MSLSEKAAYLRGLYDGMELGEEKSKEAKMLRAVIDVIQELADHVTENEESIAAVADQLDDVSDLTEILKEIALGEDDDEELLDEDEYDFDEDEDDDGEFVTNFEVECPNCQRLLTIGEEELSASEIECPTCGQRFQIDLQFENEEAGDNEEIPF